MPQANEREYNPHAPYLGALAAEGDVPEQVMTSGWMYGRGEGEARVCAHEPVVCVSYGAAEGGQLKGKKKGTGRRESR